MSHELAILTGIVCMATLIGLFVLDFQREQRLDADAISPAPARHLPEDTQ